MAYFFIVGLTALAISEITREWDWNRVWKKKDIPDLPQTPCVYVLYNKSENVIHVGSTGNLFDRISKHEKLRSTYSFDWTECDSADEAYQLKMKLQKKLGYNDK